MTEREMQVIGNHFASLSDWFLNMFVKYPEEVKELAMNEQLIRRIDKNKVFDSVLHPLGT